MKTHKPFARMTGPTLGIVAADCRRLADQAQSMYPPRALTMDPNTVLSKYADAPRLRDVYKFFRADAIAAATEIDSSLSDAEAVKAIASALKFHPATRDLFGYADFNTMRAVLIQEARDR